MKRSIVVWVGAVVVIALAAMPLAAQSADPAGFAMWTADELQRYAKSINTPNAENLPRRGQFGALILRDDKNGPFEIHEGRHDIYFIMAGEGVLTVGGTLTDAKTTGVGEIRGTGVQGGVKKKIGPGNIVVIPAKMAHHLTTEPGTEVIYFLMKLDAK